MLGSADSEYPRLISRELIFELFQPIFHRYKQTDGQTDELPWQYSALLSIARYERLSGDILRITFAIRK